MGNRRVSIHSESWHIGLEDFKFRVQRKAPAELKSLQHIEHIMTVFIFPSREPVERSINLSGCFDGLFICCPQ